MNGRPQPVVALVRDAIYPYFRGGKELRYHEFYWRLSERAGVHVFTTKWWEGSSTAHGAGCHFPRGIATAPDVLR